MSVTINCAVCAAPLRFKPSEAAKRQHCSMKCYQVTRHRQHLDRFWSNVQKSDGCWLWTGPISRDGYGKASMFNKSVRAHRLAYELTYGVSLGEMYGCHTCDNPLCVRPDHIFPGTPKTNFDDACRKGRSIHQLKRKTS